MTTGTTPFVAGQRVRLNSAQQPADGRVLAVHHSELGGWEVIVRTQDLVDRPGRTVNVHITGHQCSLLSPLGEPQRERLAS